jgi:hypothetical protein
MKKIGLAIALVAAVGLVCVMFAQPAEAFFFGGGGGCGAGGGGLFKAGGLFGGGGGLFGGGYGSGSGYGMPYYGSYGYAPGYKCKAWKKKAKKAKPMMKKAK